MIAAVRRRIGAVFLAAGKRSRQLDRRAARWIEQLRPPLARRLTKLRTVALRLWARVWRFASRLMRAIGRRLRPLAVLGLRAFSRLERILLGVTAIATRAATALSAVITPQRAICATIVASAACLIAAQFVDYRSVEVGQAAYAGLTAADPPTVGTEKPSDAHSYLLIPIALLAAIAAVLALRPARRGLGRVVIGLGLLSIAVILLVDLPAGLDTGAQASRFSGATAVLEEGFYAQLAAAAGLVIGGLLYYARPCRIRINLSGRVASARRRRRRRRGSSQRKAARRPSPHRNGAASAPASQP
jgi:hypothetical protein